MTTTKKISELPSAVTPLAGDEIMPIVQDGATRRATIDEIRDGLADEVHTHTLSDIADAGTAAGADTDDFATAAQGALADTALQPDDVGSAALNETTDFATAAQGALADSAVQPGDLAAVATSGDYDDLNDIPLAGLANAIINGCGRISHRGDQDLTTSWGKAPVDLLGVKAEGTVSAGTVKYNERMEELNELLKEGSISLEEFEAAGKKAYDELVAASDKWFDGAVRALDKYAEEATDMAANVERVVTNAMQGLEDALVKATTTGKFEFKELVDSILEDVARLLVRTQITGPLAQGLSGLISSIFGGGQSGSSGGGLFGGLFADGGAFRNGQQITAYAKGGIVGKPTIFPMANGIGLMGEAGPEAVLPLTRMSSGRLGVESAGVNGGNYFSVTVDARNSANPSATSEMVKQAVDKALSARIPGIIQTSAQIAHRKTVDTWQRRGSRFE